MKYVNIKLNSDILKNDKEFFEKLNDVIKDHEEGIMFGCKSSQRAKYLALIYAKENKNLELNYKDEVESIQNIPFKENLMKKFDLN
jgi:hypothetical protein